MHRVRSLAPRTLALGSLIAAASVLASCTDKAHRFSREELMDPDTCEECHPQHYREWKGSMHAAASDDPYVEALNALGQAETDGALGNLCMLCHAPMAVREEQTEDGLNLDDLPQHLKGVTCYTCHSVEAVDGLYNNQLVLADDDVMRGPYDDPVETDAHGSRYSVYQDGFAMESSDLCGSCHDVVTPNGLELERAYLEWSDSLYSDTDPDTGGPAYYSQRCNSCHMPGSDGPIADAEGVKVDRRRHDHSIPGWAVQVDDFPGGKDAEELQAEQLEAMAEFRKGSLCASLCLTPLDDGTYEPLVWLHNETSGHHWPTGAAQDRRAWVEVKAYVGDEVVYESGAVADGQPLIELEDTDPDLWWFGDTLFNEGGDRVHALWEASTYEPRNLPVIEQFGGDPETWRSRTYPALDQMPDRLTLRVKTRAMPLDLLDLLVEEGHLTQELRDALPTFDMGSVHLDWTEADSLPSDIAGSCVSSSKSCASPHI